MILLVVCSKDQEKTLRIYTVPDESLHQFTNVSGNEAYSFLPNEKFRTPAEEIKGSKQLKEEEERKKLATGTSMDSQDMDELIDTVDQFDV